MKSRAKLFWLGVVLPASVVYGLFRGALFVYEVPLFSRDGLAYEYMTKVQEGAVHRHPIDAVVVGDSTGSTSLYPSRIRSFFSVNLAQNWGSALGSYFTVNRFLRNRPAPRCVVMLHQYNWKHTEENFFDMLVYHGAINSSEIVETWRLGRQNEMWPADTWTAPSFFYRAAVNRLRLGSLPLVDLQKAVREPPLESFRKRRAVLEKIEQFRGFLFVSEHTVLSEELFARQVTRNYYRKFASLRSEDYYLRKIAELAEEKNFQFIYLAPPVADTDYVAPSRKFRKGRDQHVRDLLAGYKNATVLSREETRPRSFFTNFTHMNAKGARLFSLQMEEELHERCASKVGDSEIEYRSRFHEIHKLSNWDFAPMRELKDRISAAPPELSDYLNIEQARRGRAGRVTPARPSWATRKALSRAIETLPENLVLLMKRKVIGIFFVDGLQEGARTIFVRDELGRETHALIVVDSQRSERVANDWASDRERDFFAAANRADIRFEISSPRENDRAGAMQYMLLHELGYVFTIGRSGFPTLDSPWDLSSRTAFASMSWQNQKGAITNKFQLQFSSEGDPSTLYSDLRKTSFPTLRSTTDLYEDFAESFASYVHTQILKKPWKLRHPSGTVEDCWTHQRCDEKRARLVSALDEAFGKINP